jgi:uncharacterized protein (TIGR03067 family)
MIAQETNGDEVPPEKDMKLVITADMMISTHPEGYPRQEEVRKAGNERVSYRIDPSREPKTIDLTGVSGPLKEKTFFGIYRLDGDTLQICLDTDDGERPTAFDTQSGDHAKLMVFRREIPIRVVEAPAPGKAAGPDKASKPFLEFRIVADAAHDRAAVAQARSPDGLKNPPAGYRWASIDDRHPLDRGEGDIIREEPGPDGKARKHLLVKLDPQDLTEKDITRAEKLKDERDRLAISVRFTPDGGRRLGELTRTHLPEKTGAPIDFKYKLAIIIDGVVVAAPVINSEIRDAAVIEFGGTARPEEIDEAIKHIEAAQHEPAAGKRSP